MTQGVDQSTNLAGAIDSALVAFVETHLGTIREVHDLSWNHGESAVWALATRRGRAVLKVHRQGRKFSNERGAYTDWLPRLRPWLDAGTSVPNLLAVHDAHPRALLLSLAAGRLLEDLRPAPALEAEVHERAGRFLRSLHDLELADADPVPLAEAYAMRLDAWNPRGAGIIPDDVTEAVSGAMAAVLPFLADQARVPCHRDFTPRNWLMSTGESAGAQPASGHAVPPEHAGTAVLTIIDFEHAQPDLYLADLQRLWVGVWRHHPGLRDRFLKGYGRQLTSQEEEAMRGLAAFWAYSTVVWAREHDDEEFERTGWETFSWLGLT